ncbi:hypothetical protein KAI92_00695 [Candidatus Parcubacteria bacterium]|nr:hypothetical protein [Candidatus Parcubacteria bacterium]
MNIKILILFLFFVFSPIGASAEDWDGSHIQDLRDPDVNNDIILPATTDGNCSYNYNYHFERHDSKYPLKNYQSGGSGSDTITFTDESFFGYTDDFHIVYKLYCQSTPKDDNAYVVTGTTTGSSVTWHSYYVDDENYFEGDIDFLSPSPSAPVILPNMTLSFNYWNYGASVAPYTDFEFDIYSVDSSTSLYNEVINISTNNIQELKNYQQAVLLPITFKPGFYMITGFLSNDLITSPYTTEYFQIVLTSYSPDQPTFICDNFPDTWTGNLFNYLCGWIVPGENVIEDNIFNTTTKLKNSVPFVSQIHSIFMSSGLSSVEDSTTAPALADSGDWNGAVINFSTGFSVLEPVITTVKSFLTIGIYLILLLFLYKKTPLLFKSNEKI